MNSQENHRMIFPIVKDSLLNKTLPNNSIGKGPQRLAESLDCCKIVRKGDMYDALQTFENDYPCRYEGRISSGTKSKLAILIFTGTEFKIIPIRRAQEYVNFKPVVQVSRAIKKKLLKLETLTKEEKLELKFKNQPNKNSCNKDSDDEEEPAEEEDPKDLKMTLQEKLKEQEQQRIQQEEIEYRRQRYDKARKRIEEQDNELDNNFDAEHDLFADDGEDDKLRHEKSDKENEFEDDLSPAFQKQQELPVESNTNRVAEEVKNMEEIIRKADQMESDSSSSGSDIEMDDENNRSILIESVKLFVGKTKLPVKQPAKKKSQASEKKSKPSPVYTADAALEDTSASPSQQKESPTSPDTQEASPKPNGGHDPSFGGFDGYLSGAEEPDTSHG
ncbi:unnamed protein product [Moneuplotes crassus]|uniref:Uncharacterized protein n=1 Tax=Euplotes crassus TaxID=5936 RepID=A0AAD1XF34_EUPCR|nr:unnamed protein product [Moneuplotes crassus]